MPAVSGTFPRANSLERRGGILATTYALSGYKTIEDAERFFLRVDLRETRRSVVSQGCSGLNHLPPGPSAS